MEVMERDCGLRKGLEESAGKLEVWNAWRSEERNENTNPVFIVDHDCNKDLRESHPEGVTQRCEKCSSYTIGFLYRC